MGGWGRVVAAAAALAMHAPAGAQQSGAFVGDWRAVLASPGGELPFTLRIAAQADALSAHALNGAERATADSVRVSGARLVLRFDVYDSEISAELQPDGRTLVGDWTKAGKRVLAFTATSGDQRRFLPEAAAGEGGAAADVSGVWAASFGAGERAQAARGELVQQGQRVLGTFLTPVGDHRYLEGEFRDGVLRMSRFDGSAASLYVARLQPDGSLSGQLWRSAGAPQEWSAKRLDARGDGLPDAFAAAGLANAEGRLRFRFPDLQGRPVSLQDDRFRGRVVVVNLFGSWCPNCNDEAPLLREWSRRYEGRGLEILGLAYEQTGDPQGDIRAVERFARRHSLTHTLLLAGISDRKAAAATLPDLTGLFAFPTTIFVDRSGRVRKIHSGYAGPATGDHHRRLVSELTRVLEELLAEAAPATAADSR
jgi:thiol-disulfide isomerase/thioredoxin